MSTLKSLDKETQHWLKINLAKREPVAFLASQLVKKGYSDAAYELMLTLNKKYALPHIELTKNSIKLSERELDIRFTCYKPFIVAVDNFLSFEECEYLINIADERLVDSITTDDETGMPKKSKIRTSSSVAIKGGVNSKIAMIEARIAELIKWPVNNAENLEVIRYEKGQEYTPHMDYFNVKFEDKKADFKKAGQRVGTFLMYLSDVEEGGATQFKTKGIEIRPKKGSALYFANMSLEGKVDSLTLHAGMPVTKGVKYIATKWLRERPLI